MTWRREGEGDGAAEQDRTEDGCQGDGPGKEPQCKKE